jgi:hypothetical protein
MSKSYRLLYVGPLFAGSTALMRLDALRDLGHEVVALDTTPYARRGSRLARSLRYRFGIGAAVRDLNQAMLKQAETMHPDILWVDHGHYTRPDALRRAKDACGCMLVHYNCDDPFGAFRGGWRLFRRCIPVYDLHLVPRDVNLEEYRAVGARTVARFHWAYHPALHQPLTVVGPDRHAFGGGVGFVGGWERERQESMEFLARNGVSVRVWCEGWPRSKRPTPNLRVDPQSLWGQAYTRAICSMDINLGFLRKGNRDQSTTRSMEVPACGAFLLAERTPEHLALFEEGKEAEFFGSNDELLDKARYYSAHPQERQRIALAGRERCLKSGYSNQERLRAMLEKVAELRP